MALQCVCSGTNVTLLCGSSHTSGQDCFFCAVVHADGKRTKKGQNTLMFPNIIISLPPITVTSFSLDFPKTRGKHLAEFNIIIIFFFHRNIFPSNLVSAAFQSVSAATRFYNFI